MNVVIILSFPQKTNSFLIAALQWIPNKFNVDNVILLEMQAVIMTAFCRFKMLNII